MFMDRYLTPIAVLLGALIVGAALMFGNGGAGQQAGTNPTGQPPAKAVDIAKVDLKNNPYVGQENAPVTIAVWFDFQCSFCKRFENTALKEVRDIYVKEGTVRIVYKDFPILGQQSTDAALYSSAVWEAYPTRWYEWFAAMFADDGESTANLEAMNAISTSLGLDSSRIEKMMKDNGTRYQAAIDADFAEGQGFGIGGTPASIIGKQLISGAQPYAVVSAAIDAELKK